MNKKTKVYAIIPAAGQGQRMGATKTSKQFIELLGVPILARTLLAFENSKDVDGIVVVTCSSEESRIRELCASFGITKLVGVAKGGETRQDSVRNALEFLVSSITLVESEDYEPKTLITESKTPVTMEERSQIKSKAVKSQTDCYVLIHDGARPFVSNEVIERCIEGAKKYHACGAGVRVKDTIKQVRNDGRITNTPPRDELWAIQTPQAFLLTLISDLHSKAYGENLHFTDDTAIAEYFGSDVYIVDGEYRNIKITTPEDLLYGEILLKDMEQKENIL